MVVLDAPAAGITPARLPTLNQLDGMALKSQRFVAVGYGTVRENKTKGPASLFFDAASGASPSRASKLSGRRGST